MDKNIIWLLQGIIILVTFLILTMMVLWYRSRLVKKTRGKILVQIKPAAGKGWQALCDYSNGEVDIKENIKKKILPMHCTINKTATWDIDFPQNFPSFVQVQVSTVVFREGDAIPLTEDSDRPMIDATRFANLINQKDTSETIKRSADISTGVAGTNKIGGLVWVYVLLGVIVIVSGTVLFLVAAGKASWIQNLMDGLNVIKAGLGVQ